MTERAETRYKELLALAPDVESRAAIQSILFHLGVPPDLRYLIDGLRRTRKIIRANPGELRQLIQSCPDALQSAPSPWTLRKGIRIALKLAAHLEPQTSKGVDPLEWPMVRVSETQGHPLHGRGMSVCPHWTNLFCDTTLGGSSEEQSKYRTLHGQISRYVIAALIRTRDESFVFKYERWAEGAPLSKAFGREALPATRIDTASRMLRRLTLPQNFWILDLLSEGDHTLLERCEKSEARFSAEKSPKESGLEEEDTSREAELTEVTDAFRLLIELVSADKSHINRRRRMYSGTRFGGATPGPQGYVRIGQHGLLQSEDILDDGSRLIRFLATADGKSEDKTSKQDFNASPIDTADSLPHFVVEIAPDSSGSAEFRRIAAKRQQHAVIRHSIESTLARATFTPWQINAVREELASPKRFSKDDRPSFALILATLATGRDLLAQPITVLKEMPSEIKGLCYLPNGSGFWIFPIAPPAFESAKITEVERPTTQLLRVPDRFRLSGWFRDFDGENVLWSEGDKQRAVRWLQKICKDDSIGYQTLRKALRHGLLDVTAGDVAITSMITGTPLLHSRSSVHYTNVGLNRLVDAYQKAVSSFAPTQPKEVPVEEAVTLGARRVPTAEALRLLVANLRHRLTNTKGVDRRNTLVAYTLLGFQIATAGRAIDRRLIQTFESESRLVLIHEKGTPYDSRLIGLARQIQEQLDILLIELRRCGVDAHGPQGLFPFWSSEKGPDSPLTPGFFDESTALLGFDLEVYSLRRFFRSEMVIRGAAGEDIDAFMGHWFNGMSPHDPLSMYPTRRLRKFTDTFVETLLNDVGYEPCQ